MGANEMGVRVCEGGASSRVDPSTDAHPPGDVLVKPAGAAARPRGSASAAAVGSSRRQHRCRTYDAHASYATPPKHIGARIEHAEKAHGGRVRVWLARVGGGGGGA